MRGVIAGRSGVNKDTDQRWKHIRMMNLSVAILMDYTYRGSPFCMNHHTCLPVSETSGSRPCSMEREFFDFVISNAVL